MDNTLNYAIYWYENQFNQCFKIISFRIHSRVILFQHLAIIRFGCQIYVDIGVNMVAATNEYQTIRKQGMQTTFIRRILSKLPIDVVENDNNQGIHSLNNILTRQSFAAEKSFTLYLLNLENFYHVHVLKKLYEVTIYLIYVSMNVMKKYCH